MTYLFLRNIYIVYKIILIYQYNFMQILIIPIGFLLWYLAYEAKPINNDEATYIWEEENFIKRIRLQNILKDGL